MVKWMSAHADRVAMLGEEGAAKVQAVEGLQLLHAVADNDVIRVDLGNGECAWCAPYAAASGGSIWSVVAVAPMNDLHAADAVPRKLFYAAPWPDTWRTRWKKAPVVVQSRLAAVGLSVGDYVGGRLPDNSCRLAQVASVDADGRPASVYYTPLERASRQAIAADADGLAWFPIPPKWPEGCAKVFNWQQTHAKGIHGNYNFLTKRFGVEQKRFNNNLERKEKKQERKARKAAQPAQAAPVAPINPKALLSPSQLEAWRALDLRAADRVRVEGEAKFDEIALWREREREKIING